MSSHTPAKHSSSEPEANLADDREAVVKAVSQIAAGYIHEINNKLGPILLNADFIATSGQDVSGAALDIVQNTRMILEMLRDIEAILPRNMKPDASVGEMLLLAKRIAQGTLRRRRLNVVLPEFDTEVQLTTEPVATFLAMLLLTQLFHGPLAGDPGTLNVKFTEPEKSWLWQIEVDPPCPPDPEVLGAITGLCQRNGWAYSSGAGFFSLSKA